MLTDPQPPALSPTPSRSVAIQTDDPPSHPMAMAAVQVNTPKPILASTPLAPCTVDAIIQTSPSRILGTSSQTTLHPSPRPDPVHITSPPPMSLNWADDAVLLLISSLSILSPPISPLPIPSPPILSSHPPRDLSALRSSSPKPFSSLQHRNKRSQTYHSQSFYGQPSFITPRRRYFPPPWVSFSCGICVPTLV